MGHNPRRIKTKFDTQPEEFFLAEYLNGNVKDCSFDVLKNLKLLGGFDWGYPKFNIRIFTDGDTLYTPDRPKQKGR